MARARAQGGLIQYCNISELQRCNAAFGWGVISYYGKQETGYWVYLECSVRRDGSGTLQIFMHPTVTQCTIANVDSEVEDDLLEHSAAPSTENGTSVTSQFTACARIANEPHQGDEHRLDLWGPMRHHRIRCVHYDEPEFGTVTKHRRRRSRGCVILDKLDTCGDHINYVKEALLVDNGDFN